MAESHNPSVALSADRQALAKEGLVSKYEFYKMEQIIIPLLFISIFGVAVMRLLSIFRTENQEE